MAATESKICATRPSRVAMASRAARATAWPVLNLADSAVVSDGILSGVLCARGIRVRQYDTLETFLVQSHPGPLRGTIDALIDRHPSRAAGRKTPGATLCVRCKQGAPTRG